jgi:hypothetical protein
MIHIGSAIRKAHKQKDVLFKTVAAEIDCTPANYAHTLERASITLHRYKQICDSLEMTMDDVYKLGEEI